MGTDLSPVHVTFTLLYATHISIQLVYLIYKYFIINTDTFSLVGKERLKYLIGTNFRGHFISRKKVGIFRGSLFSRFGCQIIFFRNQFSRNYFDNLIIILQFLLLKIINS